MGENLFSCYSFMSIVYYISLIYLCQKSLNDYEEQIKKDHQERDWIYFKKIIQQIINGFNFLIYFLFVIIYIYWFPSSPALGRWKKVYLNIFGKFFCFSVSIFFLNLISVVTNIISSSLNNFNII